MDRRARVSRYYRRKMSTKTAMGMVLGKLLGLQVGSEAGKRTFRLCKGGTLFTVEYREILESN